MRKKKLYKIQLWEIFTSMQNFSINENIPPSKSNYFNDTLILNLFHDIKLLPYIYALINSLLKSKLSSWVVIWKKSSLEFSLQRGLTNFLIDECFEVHQVLWKKKEKIDERYYPIRSIKKIYFEIFFSVLKI